MNEKNLFINSTKSDLMIQNSKKTKIYHILLKAIIIISILIISSLVVIADEETNTNLKITLTKIDMSNGFQKEIQLLPISLETIEEITTFNHVKQVIPAINKKYGSFQNNRSFPGKDSMPNPNGNPTNSNRQFSRDKMMNQIADFIVEGINVNNIEPYISSILSINLESGRYPTDNDSSIAIIGKSAQEYFNVTLNENITIEETDFTVIGIFDNETYNNLVIIKLNDAQLLYDLDSDEINTIYVYVDNSSSVENLVNDLSYTFPYFQIRSSSSFSNSFKDNLDLNNGISENNTPGFEVLILIFVVCFFLILKRFSQEGKNDVNKLQ